MTDNLKLVRFDEMVAMMRQQRDQFRDPANSLGATHGQETREKMANLLDWFLAAYADEQR